MKPFARQTHYELLEVSVSATPLELRAAYERLNRLYGENQVALYGLALDDQTQELRRRLGIAYQVLSDDARRDEYDASIGLPPREKEPAAPVPLPTLSVPPFVATKPAGPEPVAPPSLPAPPALREPVALVAPLAQVPAPQPSPQPPREEQLSMADLLQHADASVVSTNPRVSFEYQRQGDDALRTELPAVTMTPPQRVSAPESVASISAPPSAPHSPAPLPPAPAHESNAPPPEDAPRLAEESAILESTALALRPLTPRPRASVSPPARPKPPDLPPDTEFNGEILRTVRQGLQLSLAQVADHTRVGIKHLENLEADRYQALPAAVYLRGMLMAFAKELGLDPLRVSQSYLKLVEKARSGK